MKFILKRLKAILEAKEILTERNESIEFIQSK